MSERTHLLHRLKFESDIHLFFTQIFNDAGIEYALRIMQKAPELLSDFIKRYSSELEGILLLEQQRDSQPSSMPRSVKISG